MKIIFITGASTGLGKATAKLFASKGWNVIATMRHPDKELSKIKNITVMQLDVTNLEQINKVVKEATKKDIDVVFNNAGYGMTGPFEAATDEEIQKLVNTNLLGVMRVTKAFIPYFRERKKGIFITTTSIGGHVSFPLNSVYNASKWALEGWCESLTYELSEFNIMVKTVAPGGMSTEFSKSIVMTEHKAYKALEKILNVFKGKRVQLGFTTPEEVAMVVYEAATDNKKKLRYIAGKDAKMIYAFRRWAGDRIFMWQIRRSFLR